MRSPSPGTSIMKPTCLPILLFLFGFFSFCLSNESPSLTTESALRHCDCYLVSGTDPGYFQHYQLWDFRDAPVPREFRPFDASYDNDDDNDLDDVYSEHNILPLSHSTFANDWKVQSWNRRSVANKPTTVINSADNVFLARDHLSAATGNNHTYLVLRTTQLQDHNSAAELESRLTNIYRCSLRIRFQILPHGGLVGNPNPKPRPRPRPRPRPAPAAAPAAAKPKSSPPPTGACAGIFTYDRTGAESDIEILTRNPENIIHYANQPDYDPVTDTAIPGASIIAALPKPWTEWATHRLDWFRNLSVWSQDGQVQTTNTYRVPEIPSTLVLNLWSDGGEWTGNLGVGESVYLGIEWIQLVYNISDTPGNKKTDCRRPCWVDDAFRF